MKIGLFGGSFDPPHLGHLIIADQICNHFNLDQILWIPAAQNPLKEIKSTANHHRLEMLRIITKDNPNFIVNEFEINRTGPSYTIDTLKHFSKTYPNPANKLYFIMGSDSIKDFHKWKSYQEIPKLAEIIVFQRTTQEVNYSQYCPDCKFIATVQTSISSTLIRNNIKDKKSIKYLVPTEVQSYIYKNTLYGS